MNNIPEKFHKFLGEFSQHDEISWGYRIVEQVGEELWEELGKHGALTYFMPRGVPPYWALITKSLSREDLIEQYGPITEEKFGPRGGWKSVTFGHQKTLSNKSLKKSREELPPDHPVVIGK